MELPTDPDALRERLKHIVASTSRFALTDHLLGMNGCDHQPIQMDLHKVIALANKVQDEVEVKQSNFKDYVEAVRPYKDSFPVFEGEINGQLSAGSCPLICTASAHVDIKQKNHDVQHLLERIAEPAGMIAKLGGGEWEKAKTKAKAKTKTKTRTKIKRARVVRASRITKISRIRTSRTTKTIRTEISRTTRTRTRTSTRTARAAICTFRSASISA